MTYRLILAKTRAECAVLILREGSTSYGAKPKSLLEPQMSLAKVVSVETNDEIPEDFCGHWMFC